MNEQLRSRPGFVPEPALQLTQKEMAARLAETSLELVSEGNGRDFRYAFMVPALDAFHNYYRVTIDAASEQILHVENAMEFGNCYQTEPRTNYTATGHPIRPEFYDGNGNPTRTRALRANGSPDRGGDADLDYEGFFQSYSVYPSMSVLQEVTADAFQCYPDNLPSRNSAYTLFPLKSDLIYRDFFEANYDWRGRRAGDALFFTSETMAALNSMGLNSWNRVGGDANIEVEYIITNDTIGDPTRTDNAFFRGCPSFS